MRLQDLGPLKIFGFLDRRQDITLDAFRQHWRTTHAAQALKLTPFFTAYVQNHRRDEGLPGFDPPCDGAPEIWFQDPQNIAAMNSSDAYMSGAYLDEPNFMEGRSRGVVTRELTQNAGPDLHQNETSFKALVFAKRSASLSFQDFEARYESLNSPIIELAQPPLRFMRAVALAPAENEPAPLFDAVEEYWWADRDAFRTAWGDGALNEEAHALIDRRSSAGLLAEEVHVYWPTDGVHFA